MKASKNDKISQSSKSTESESESVEADYENDKAKMHSEDDCCSCDSDPVVTEVVCTEHHSCQTKCEEKHTCQDDDCEEEHYCEDHSHSHSHNHSPSHACPNHLCSDCHLKQLLLGPTCACCGDPLTAKP